MPIPFASRDLFEIILKYVEVENKAGLTIPFILRTPEQEEKYKDRTKTIRTQWKQPGWKESQDLIRDSQVMDDMTGNKEVDMRTYRNHVLHRMLKSWDVCDEAGKPIPLTAEVVDSLDPNIAMFFADAWLTRTSVTETDLGN